MSSSSSETINQTGRHVQASNSRWTLAGRFTAWYAISFVVVLAGLALLMYMTLSSALRREADSRLLAEADELLEQVKLEPLTGDRLKAVILADEAIDQAGRRHASSEPVVIVVRAYQGDRMVYSDGLLSRLVAAEGFPPTVPEGHDSPFTNAVATDGTSYRIGSVQAGEGDARVVLHLATDTSFEARILSRYRKQMIVIVAAGTVVCAAISYLTALLAVRPVARMVAAVDRIEADNLDIRLPVEGLPEELARLSDGFNALLGRLEASFARIAGFTADIAHEMRTPLAALRSEIEVVLLNARTPNDYRRALESSLEEARRLQLLIDRLLFLARAENNEAAIRVEPTDAKAELSTIRDFYEPMADEAGVGLKLSAARGVELRIDRMLFQSAIGNLVENAIRHTPRGGSVCLSVETVGEATRVEVRDTGCGIAAEHIPFVCDRLFQIDRSRSRRDGHVGLGLAIVKSIVDLHGGTVEITSELGVGTTVTISFSFR